MKSHSTSQKWNIQTILPGLRYEKAGLGRGARTKGMSRRRSWKDYWIISNYIILYDKIIILYKYMNMMFWLVRWICWRFAIIDTSSSCFIYKISWFDMKMWQLFIFWWENGFFVSQLKYQAQVIKFSFPVSTNKGRKEVVLKSEW